VMSLALPFQAQPLWSSNGFYLGDASDLRFVLA
jgi:hypothetical protein